MHELTVFTGGWDAIKKINPLQGFYCMGPGCSPNPKNLKKT
jgi:hypothetical protein